MPQFGPEVERLKDLTKELVRSGGGMASSKWTWGVDLTNDDLLGLIRGADRQGQNEHTGYHTFGLTRLLRRLPVFLTFP